MSWYRLFLPFASAYFLSYLFRTINAVVGPILGTELSLGAAQLGLLTSAYFIAFGAAQLPLGMLLDRFGARRVNAGLLLFAATGAAVAAVRATAAGAQSQGGQHRCRQRAQAANRVPWPTAGTVRGF